MTNTNKIIGMGESILDILFRDGQPVAAVPGGSSFNSIVSVGRAGLPCGFVGFTGSDQVGRNTLRFLHDNGVDTRHFRTSEAQSAVSLAFLDADSNASYSFYKPAVANLTVDALPEFRAGDALLFGSYYACQPEVRPLVRAVLCAAAQGGATVYYDLNFRPAHRHQLPALRCVIADNFGHSSVVRASEEDCQVVFGTGDPVDVYRSHVARHCAIFVCTAGPGRVTLCTPRLTLCTDVPPLEGVVSTVGAGDSFNAGFVCALTSLGLTAANLPALDENTWRQVLDTACRFARACCVSNENYIPQGARLLEPVIG